MIICKTFGLYLNKLFCFTLKLLYVCENHICLFYVEISKQTSQMQHSSSVFAGPVIQYSPLHEVKTVTDFSWLLGFHEALCVKSVFLSLPESWLMFDVAYVHKCKEKKQSADQSRHNSSFLSFMYKAWKVQMQQEQMQHLKRSHFSPPWSVWFTAASAALLGCGGCGNGSAHGGRSHRRCRYTGAEKRESSGKR